MADGRKALVEQLFTQYGAGLRAFLRRRVPAEPDAAELAQEVYSRMLRVADADAIRNTEAYLYTVAGNLVKEYRVLGERRRAAVDVDSEAVQGELAVLPDWSNELDEARRARRLREVLGQLPDECRAVLALHYWRGLTYEEVARELGVSRRVVKRHLARGLAHCRRRMQGMR